MYEPECITFYKQGVDPAELELALPKRACDSSYEEDMEFQASMKMDSNQNKKKSSKSLEVLKKIFVIR